MESHHHHDNADLLEKGLNLREKHPGENNGCSSSDSAAGLLHRRTPTMTTHPNSSNSNINSSSGPSLESSCENINNNKHLAGKFISINSSTDKQTGTIRIHQSGTSKWLLTILIVVLGTSAGAAFIAFGVHAAHRDSNRRFQSSAQSVADHMLSSWKTYELFGSWIHESCDHLAVGTDGNSTTTTEDQLRNSIDPYQDWAGHVGWCSRAEFRRLYESIKAQGVDFLSAQLVRNITHELRDPLEQEAREYYQKYYPGVVNYTGIVAQIERNSKILVPQQEADYYMPIHYVEPVLGNERIIEIDKISSQGGNNVLDAIRAGKPVVTPRLRLLQETVEGVYGVILAHPGTRTSVDTASTTRTVAQIVVRVPSFLQYALRSTGAIGKQAVYLYDSTDSQESPAFLGAVTVHNDESSSDQEHRFTHIPEVEKKDVVGSKDRNSFQFEVVWGVAEREYTLIVTRIRDDESYHASLLFVYLGGSIIIAASIICAIWLQSHLRRLAQHNRVKSQAEQERAELAHAQAVRERDLNEFIAHEVRNPLSSAISAMSFVSVGVADNVPDPNQKSSLLNDVNIVESSLQFINELLRNMLDIHRAGSRQIKLDFSPVDVRQDILEPVAAVLFMRGAKVKIDIVCPPDLAVMGDRMRLKQIMLNLSANATKFVQKGYIRLRAAEVNGSIELYVEDSGMGIPAEKRGLLFAKFQESLDSLNQGTGIGLCVCKNLSELMGADISLDENFVSGIEGCPGTRFILRLNQPAVNFENEHHSDLPTTTTITNAEEAAAAAAAAGAVGCCALHDTNGSALNIVDNLLQQLPVSLSVLVVDDDTMIRKMFKRAALRVAPTWDLEEACNGETALVLCERQTFDVIFLDQYMASVEKQLLGTETARALRSRGVQSIICGLSANDMEQQFRESGADAFMMKPFPCQKEAMAKAFYEVLRSSGRAALTSSNNSKAI